MDELSKIKWRCRRGMRELDVVLNAYVECCYADASESEQSAFTELLELEDDLFYHLLLGKAQAADGAQEQVLEKLRKGSVLTGR